MFGTIVDLSETAVEQPMNIVSEPVDYYSLDGCARNSQIPMFIRMGEGYVQSCWKGHFVQREVTVVGQKGTPGLKISLTTFFTPSTNSSSYTLIS